MRFSKVILGLLIGFGFCFALDPDAEGIYNKIKGAYGTKEGIRENITKPATGTSSYKTFSGETFDAPISCPSEERAVVIVFSALSGNDYKATINEDLDLDGTFDYTYTTPNISGICTNGIVSCQEGTWNNCKYYYWISSGGKVSLIETTDTSKTGSCACTNVSCGINTLDQPLFSMIGGGVSQVISKENPKLAISKSRWNGSTLELFGYNTADCTTPTSSLSAYGESNPTSYYEDQVPPSVTLADVEAEQGSDPYSPYSIISGVLDAEYEPGKTIGLPAYEECFIRNTVFTSGTEYFTDGGCNLGTSNPCTGGIEKVGDNLYKCSVSATDNGCGQTYELSLCGKWETSWNVPDDERAYIEINGTVVLNIDRKGDDNEGGSGSCSGNTIDGSSAGNCSAGYTASTSPVPAKFIYKNNGSCNGVPTSSLYYYYRTKDIISVNLTDTCPSSCTLQDEWVCDKDGSNCIQTIKDGAVLSVTIPKQCYTFTTSISTYIVCSDGKEITVQSFAGTEVIGSGWFYVKRRYNCGTQNIDIDLTKTKEAIKSSNIDGQLISYVDPNTGSSNTADFSKIETDPCLTPICTVKIHRTDTAVFSDDSNRSDTAAGTESLGLEVRTCNKSGSVLTCPLNSGEEIVEDCKCDIGQQRVGFQTAVTSMQVLKEVSKDMICSSSPP